MAIRHKSACAVSPLPSTAFGPVLLMLRSMPLRAIHDFQAIHNPIKTKQPNKKRYSRIASMPDSLSSSALAKAPPFAAWRVVSVSVVGATSLLGAGERSAYGRAC
jgi:hypothetical protein